MLPNALLFTVPGTTLFAACLVYGRMSSSNEMLAVKAVGLSPMELIWPLFYLSVLLSLFTLWLNDVAWSWGYQGVQRVVLEAGEEIAYSMLRMHRNYATKQFSINVKDVRDKRLIQPTITFYSAEGRTTTITAEEAELRSDLRNETLTILCRDASMDVENVAAMIVPGTFERVISLKDFRQHAPSTSPSRMSLARIRQERLEREAEMEVLQREQAVLASAQMLLGEFDAPAAGRSGRCTRRCAGRRRSICIASIRSLIGAGPTASVASASCLWACRLPFGCATAMSSPASSSASFRS